ncbi:hypothetical protein MKW94_029300 [Papaver nudicaule]|uniref:Peptidase metallopeptidase domain-containing protein n=1 Tax=Papaver nudicaule TaxID=74823 RepID=A0AA41RRK7_PAPNU|nr:hypothetical protein [Papaver nudicaule]
MTNPKAAASLLQTAPFISLFLLAIFPYPILSSKYFQSFDFPQQLDGCHKGQTVKSIHEIKQYLRKFGYLDVYKNHTEHEDNDEFDDILESGIRTYQFNYHLKATGKLDAQTVKQMRLPRCGVPDIVNGKTSMRSGKKKHTKGGKSSSVHSVLHYSFFQGSPRWPASKSHLTYQFSSTIPVTDLKTLKTVSSRAFARWAEVSHFTFSEATDEADIVIGFYSGDHGDGSSFDGPGGMLAHSFSPTDGRLHFDADENWSTNPGQDMMDLETVAVHEIGHLLGLEHSSEPKAIMYPTILFGSLKRQLHGDDVQGIRSLYGHLA